MALLQNEEAMLEIRIIAHRQTVEFIKKTSR